jgi:hypothetical protein
VLTLDLNQYALGKVSFRDKKTNVIRFRSKNVRHKLGQVNKAGLPCCLNARCRVPDVKGERSE